MWLLLLAYLERTLVWVQTMTEQAKQKLREWLGPAPQNFLLLGDGRVLPAHIQIPEAEHASTYMYETATRRISLLQNPTPAGRFRQLPIIACTIEKSGVTHDLSDWFSELRANPVPSSSLLKQYVHLYCLVFNTYVPMTGNVTTTLNNGDVETSVWSD